MCVDLEKGVPTGRQMKDDDDSDEQMRWMRWIFDAVDLAR